ncbi:MAG: hypothetical protein HQ518_26450 [Rhodopirellula sp.]|nr:hypothetical protein [Rhodopirellula sp.]
MPSVTAALHAAYLKTFRFHAAGGHPQNCCVPQAQDDRPSAHVNLGTFNLDRPGTMNHPLAPQPCQLAGPPSV